MSEVLCQLCLCSDLCEFLKKGILSRDNCILLFVPWAYKQLLWKWVSLLCFVCLCLFLGRQHGGEVCSKFIVKVSFGDVNVLQEGQWEGKYNHFILLNTELDFVFFCIITTLFFVVSVTKRFLSDPWICADLSTCCWLSDALGRGFLTADPCPTSKYTHERIDTCAHMYICKRNKTMPKMIWHEARSKIPVSSSVFNTT